MFGFRKPVRIRIERIGSNIRLYAEGAVIIRTFKLKARLRVRRGIPFVFEKFRNVVAVARFANLTGKRPSVAQTAVVKPAAI